MELRAIQLQPRIEDRISLHPASWLRIVYMDSRISSIPFRTNGAAAAPTTIPETERSMAASIQKRASTNSVNISKIEIRSQRAFAGKPSHSEAKNPK